MKAIKETVPVYQDRFRLVRDVTVARDAALGRCSIRWETDH